MFYSFDTFDLVILQFRAAIQLQFDFHRAIYNLGTVLVGLLVILSLHYFYGMIYPFEYRILCSIYLVGSREIPYDLTLSSHVN